MAYKSIRTLIAAAAAAPSALQLHCGWYAIEALQNENQSIHCQIVITESSQSAPKPTVVSLVMNSDDCKEEMKKNHDSRCTQEADQE